MSQQGTQVEKVSSLTLIGDYVLPVGMIDFKTPATMVMEYMVKVQEDPENEQKRATLKALSDAARTVVSAGVAQTEQGKMMIELLRVNKELKLM